jgi:ferredoxin-type protein NapF
MSDSNDASAAAARPWRRWLVRFACLTIACALLVPAWPWDPAVLAVPALSPFVAIGSAIAVRAVSLVSLVALPVLLIVLVRRRWFCRYVCPTGLLADLVGRVRGPGAARGVRLPPIGQWLALLTLGGAVVGYPLFLWLDPLAIFAGFVHAWGRGLGLAVWLSAAGLPLVLFVSLLMPGVWCARLCPLGATQDLLAWPWRMLRRRGQGEAASAEAWPLTRRAIIAGGLGGLGGLPMFRFLSRSASPPLRPPGVADGDRFTGLCVRCGSCARVCPSRILHPDLGEFGADSFLTPVIRYRDEYCLETCQRCTNVCPSGALRPLTAEEKPQAAIGLPRVDMAVCLLGDDRECAICINACPYAAIRLVFSEDTYLNTPTIDPQRCNGCGACQVRCPTAPVKAIVVYSPDDGNAVTRVV